MYSITKSFVFCYGHRLYKDPGKCGHLHGHTGRAEVALEGEELDGLGMLKNFDSIKESVGRWIEDNFDHRTLLNRDDPLAETLIGAGEKIFLMGANPTAENIARAIYESSKKGGLPVSSVTFWESPTACARYSG
jgi:6-pyruvoyltetrahydropterin/6-carboxytetrahydropterin synthase